MIPYIALSDLQLGPVSLSWFWLFVALGTIGGTFLARWRGRKLGLDVPALDSFIWWMLVGGFMGAHVLDEVFYHPDTLRHRPATLFLLWRGISSVGGFIGALIAVLLWRSRCHRPILPFADCVLSVFPISWSLGRAGCSIAHDHPGRAASRYCWLAVNWPGGPRYDLGLLEMVFAILLSVAIAFSWRRRFCIGMYVVLVCVAYAPVRFGLDFLRLSGGPEDSSHYLTLAQWACIVLFLFGVRMQRRIVRQQPS